MSKKSGLRERKYARTKLALVDALIDALKKASMADISVKALCNTAEVSEATFFNYFDKKSDLLNYYIHLWILEMGWHTHQVNEQGLVVIDAMFERAARRFQQHPGLMGEVIAYQASQREKSETIELSMAERLLAFPDKKGVEVLPIAGLDTVWGSNVQYAIEQGDLPENTHLPTVMVGLVSIFYGVPMTLLVSSPGAIATMYRHQLTIFWAGITQTGGSRA
jgi:AcrR family transcriptional regulator